MNICQKCKGRTAFKLNRLKSSNDVCCASFAASVLISCLIITDHLSLRCSVIGRVVLASSAVTDGQRAWHCPGRCEPLTFSSGVHERGGLDHPGRDSEQTGEARLTLRHIMNTVEVSVSKDQGCRTVRRGEEGMERERSREEVRQE